MSVSLFDIVIVAGIILILWAILSLATASTTQDKSYPPLERNEVQLTTQTTTQPEPTSLSGTCYVIDGDTIVIGKQKIRFAGMNAPELNEPYGKQAKWALVELCKGQIITAYPTGETTFDRIVAKCFLPDGRDLAAEMVKMELALDIPHFPNADYKVFETPNSRRKLNWKPKKK
jgi:micrococcal nuclease